MHDPLQLWQSSLQLLRQRFVAAAQRHAEHENGLPLQLGMLHIGPTARVKDPDAELRNLMRPAENYRPGGQSYWGDLDNPESCYLRKYGFVGRDTEINEFRYLAEEATHCLWQAPKPLREGLSRDLLRAPAGLPWLGYLYELAWERRLGSPLHARKQRWVGWTKFPYEMTSLRQALTGSAVGESGNDDSAEVPPDRYCSVLPDALMASAHALGYLACASEGLEYPTTESQEPASVGSDFLVERRRDVWRFYFQGNESILQDRLGIQYLVQLLASQGKPIDATSLVLICKHLPELCFADSKQEVIDSDSLARIHQRLAEVNDELLDAEQDNDEASVKELQEERAELLSHASKATGLGGKLRTFSDDSKRHRKSVRKAIVGAWEYMKGEDAALTLHFERSTKLESELRYQPTPPVPWEFRQVLPAK